MKRILTFFHSFREQLIFTAVVIFAVLSFFSLYLYAQVKTLTSLQNDVFSGAYGTPYILSSINVLLLKQENAVAAFCGGGITKETVDSEVGDLSKKIEERFSLMAGRLSDFENSRFFAKDKEVLERLNRNFGAVKSEYGEFENKLSGFFDSFSAEDRSSCQKFLDDTRKIRFSLENRVEFFKSEIDNLIGKYSLIAEQTADNLLRAAFLFIAVMLIVIFGMSSNVVLRLVYSLEAILQGIRRFHAGELDRPIVLKSKNEFGIIARSLNESMVKLEESLSEAKRLVRLVESSIEGIIVTDTDGVIQYVNPAWEKLTGWKTEEVVKKATPRVLKSGEHNQEFYKKLWKTITGGKIFRAEFTNKRKDRSFYTADEVIMPLLGPDGKINGFAGFQRDITEKKTVEKELKELNESRESFIKNTAHGLRTPLSAIGYTFEILMDKVSELPPWTHQFLIGAREHFVWMREILENFIFIQELNADYFKRKDAKVSPRAELSAVADHTRWFAGSKNISFEWFSENLPESLPVDRTAFLFLIKQLLDNAQIYTRPHGKIVLSTFEENGMFIIEAADTGVGIPRDDQSYIFKPFFRARNAYEMKNVGTGIGLYLVKMITEGYGGNVFFRSTEGKGSAFTVRIPVQSRVA